MTTKRVTFEYKEYASVSELALADRELMELARAGTKKAYAPYSQFYVSAVAMLDNHTTISGTNQENASFPVCICAERVLLSAMSSTCDADVRIVTMAVSYASDREKFAGADFPISPCGMCRQALSEQVHRQKQDIRLLLSGQTGPIYLLDRATDLLPMRFSL